MPPLFVNLMSGTLYNYIVSTSNESLLLSVTVQGTFLTAELGELCHCKAVGATKNIYLCLSFCPPTPTIQ